jgi:hypothetical protein
LDVRVKGKEQGKNGAGHRGTERLAIGQSAWKVFVSGNPISGDVVLRRREVEPPGIHHLIEKVPENILDVDIP